MKDKDVIVVSICNVCKVAIFATLAFVFNRWWIVLFSLLFMSTLTVLPRHYRICDICGKHSEHADTIEQAIKKAKAAGWVHIKDGDKDYCPDCKN